MMEWFDTLTTTQQILVGIAIPTTVIFILQTLATFMGLGDSDMDMDHDTSFAEGAGILGYFTLRNAVAFFLGLSWGGFTLLNHLAEPLALLGGFVLGVVLVLLNIGLMKMMQSLQDSGNLVLSNAIGATATISVMIPPTRSGYGKVSVAFQGRLTELEAVTDQDTPLARGAMVTVTATAGDKLVVN